jgi:hypothetical protein
MIGGAIEKKKNTLTGFLCHPRFCACEPGCRVYATAVLTRTPHNEVSETLEAMQQLFV